DITTPYNLTITLMRDIQSQAPDAICELTPTNVSRNLIVNRDKPPFDDPDVRRAMALTLDRKAFIDTINEGKADIGGAMLPPPEGVWECRQRCCEACPVTILTSRRTAPKLAIPWRSTATAPITGSKLRFQRAIFRSTAILRYS